MSSLLAPGNFPALRTAQRSKFLIATLPADWEYMRTTAIFREMERYVDPVFIEIPPCPPDTLTVIHMGVGHVATCGMAYRDKAYGVILAPDCLVSDGTVGNLQSHAAAGVELVWVAALRFGEEPFLGHLRANGALPRDEDRVNAGKPLILSGRDLVLAGVNGMHSETLTYEWDSPYIVNAPSALWWRVPGENGIVLHSLSWAPLLLDFAATKHHDTSALESWTIDGDYVFKNLGAAPRMHVVQDSDEMFYCGWSALADRPYPLAPRFTNPVAWMNTLAKMEEFKAAFYGPSYDPLKRKNFFLPVRWHANPINSRWRPVERRAQRILRFTLSQFRPGRHPASQFPLLTWPHRAALIILNGTAATATGTVGLARRMAALVNAVWRRRHDAGRTLRRLAAGDREARAELAYRWRQAIAFVLSGRDHPRP